MDKPAKPATVRGKRTSPTDGFTENEAPDPKRTRSGDTPKGLVSKNTEPKATEPVHPVARVNESQTSNSQDVEWKDEEKYWIKCHYQLLLCGLAQYPCKAPEGTVSCAYFNAYFQGYVSEPPYPKRTFIEFNREVERNNKHTFEQVTAKSQDNTKAGSIMVFHPILTPSILGAFIKIQEEFSTKDQFNSLSSDSTPKLNKFIEDVVAQQIEPDKSTWIADGLANILSRPRVDVRYHTLRELGEPHEGNRPIPWNEDPSTRKYSMDYMEISHGLADPPKKDEGQKFRLAHRNVHGDAGSALLNMAIMRPDGYDGDLKLLVEDGEAVELPQMGEQQRVDFEEHIRAVKTGNELREKLHEEVGWLIEDTPVGKAVAGQSEKTD